MTAQQCVGAAFFVAVAALWFGVWWWSWKEWVAMNREEIRHRMLSAIDRAMSHTWLVPKDDQALLRAVRTVTLRDDAVVDEVGAELAVELKRGDDMAKKTTGPVTAPDWAKLKELLQQYGPVVLQTVISLLSLMSGHPQAEARKALACGPDGCCVCGECLDYSIALTVEALAAQLQAKDCCPTPPAPTPAP